MVFLLNIIRNSLLLQSSITSYNNTSIYTHLHLYHFHKMQIYSVIAAAALSLAGTAHAWTQDPATGIWVANGNTYIFTDSKYIFGGKYVKLVHSS